MIELNKDTGLYMAVRYQEAVKPPLGATFLQAVTNYLTLKAVHRMSIVAVSQSIRGHPLYSPEMDFYEAPKIFQDALNKHLFYGLRVNMFYKNLPDETVVWGRETFLHKQGNNFLIPSPVISLDGLWDDYTYFLTAFSNNENSLKVDLEGKITDWDMISQAVITVEGMDEGTQNLLRSN